MITEAREVDKKIESLAEVANKPWHSAVIFTHPKKTLKQLSETYKNELGPFVFDSEQMPKLLDVEKMLKKVVKNISLNLKIDQHHAQSKFE